jgi:peptide/nickel transport system permease protein
MTAENKPRPRRSTLWRLLHHKGAVICGAYLLALVVVAVVAPPALPGVGHQQAGDLSLARQGPSGGHLLGTDTLGRDVLERLLVGTRMTLVGVAEALVVMAAIGVPAGIAAGYLGGRVDRIVTWIADLIFSVPGVIIVLVVLSVLHHSMAAGMVTWGVLAAPGVMRVARSAAQPVRDELYVAAAQASGLSDGYIMARHVFPRVLGAIVVQLAFLSAVTLHVQTGLAYLNLIVPAPAPSWGGMIGDGIANIDNQAWLIWPPGMIVAVTTIAFGVIGNAVSDTNASRWSAVQATRRRRVSERPPDTRRSAATLVEEPGRLLSVTGLTVAFERADGSRSRAVEGVSFDVNAGETVCLVGESGCGKTTTAVATVGLVPGNAVIESGQVWLDGVDTVGLSKHALSTIRGRVVGFVSQEPMVGLNPAFTVEWQLAELVRRHRRMSRKDARKEVHRLLGEARLPDPARVARMYPRQLSGGMAQRVSIARALAGEPKLLIADEPTTALDVTVQAEIIDLLHDLQRERRMGLLLVTHDWGVVAEIADRVVVMYAGQIIEQAATRGVFGHPEHPYTSGLLAADPHHTLARGDVLPTIAGTVPRPGEWPEGCRFHPRCAFATAACTDDAIPLRLAGPHQRHVRCVHPNSTRPESATTGHR